MIHLIRLNSQPLIVNSDLIKLLIDRYGFAPDRLSAAGYAEFHPVAPNDSPEGRARNRRVDIVVLNPTPVEHFDDSGNTHVTVTPDTSGAARSSQDLARPAP